MPSPLVMYVFANEVAPVPPLVTDTVSPIFAFVTAKAAILSVVTLAFKIFVVETASSANFSFVTEATPNFPVVTAASLIFSVDIA